MNKEQVISQRVEELEDNLENDLRCHGIDADVFISRSEGLVWVDIHSRASPDKQPTRVSLSEDMLERQWTVYGLTRFLSDSLPCNSPSSIGAYRPSSGFMDGLKADTVRAFGEIRNKRNNR